jgi:uncharacterized tellurite resistance protein B-like protein
MIAPEKWSEREWLLFLLLSAAHADGTLAHVEMRKLEVGLGPHRVIEMEQQFEALDPDARAAVLQSGLQRYAQSRQSRDRLQKLLLQVFMADGEYSAREQAWVKQIGDWIRAANAARDRAE